MLERTELIKLLFLLLLIGIELLLHAAEHEGVCRALLILLLYTAAI